MSQMKVVDTRCPCGLKISFTVIKPNGIIPTVSKSECECGSKFMLKCIRKSGEIEFDFDEPELSDVARAAVQKIIDEKNKTEQPAH